MSAGRYRQLALGEDVDSAVAPIPLARFSALSDTLGPLLASCARGHGAQGGGRGTGAFPILTGQNQAYLLASLRAYASGDRARRVMQPIAAGLNDNVLQQLAEHYATLPPIVSRGAAKPVTESIVRGKKLAAIGKREQKVPSCVHCHGPSEKQRNPMYPVLAGQYTDYLALQLRLFYSRRARGNRVRPDHA